MYLERYQIHSTQGPPPTPEADRPEASHPDAWWLNTNEPVREAPYSKAALEPGFYPDHARLLDAEFPSLDKWKPEYPSHHLVPLYPVNEGLFLPDVARLLDEEFTFTTWWRQTEEPVRTWPFLISNGTSLDDPARLLDAEFPSLDKWNPVYPIVRIDPIWPIGEGNFLPDYARLLDAEFPSVDKWWVQAPEPLDPDEVVDY